MISGLGLATGLAVIGTAAVVIYGFSAVVKIALAAIRNCINFFGSNSRPFYGHDRVVLPSRRGGQPVRQFPSRQRVTGGSIRAVRAPANSYVVRRNELSQRR